MVEKVVGTTISAYVGEFIAFEAFLANHPDFRANANIGPSDISAEQLKAFIRADKGKIRPRAIPSFYEWCWGQGFAGYDAQERVRLKNIRYPSSTKGMAIRSRDPKRGALTWEEQRAVYDALRNPSKYTIPTDRLITWLFLELGVRKGAVAMMRFRHFRRTPLGDAYTVDVPRVKQAGPTEQTFQRKVSKDLGDFVMSFFGGIRKRR